MEHEEVFTTTIIRNQCRLTRKYCLNGNQRSQSNVKTHLSVKILCVPQQIELYSFIQSKINFYKTLKNIRNKTR